MTDKPGAPGSIVKEARRRYKYACDVEADQRAAEREDLAFQVPELQWTEEAKKMRQGGDLAGMTIPARPMLSISKLGQPVALQLELLRRAHFGVNIHPVSQDADKKQAEVKQGVYRAIERDGANVAREWAFDRAIKAGTGYYIVRAVWDDSTPDPFDQKLVIRRVLDQATVHLDPTAEQPDWSDGEWGFLETWIPLERFKRDFPKSSLANDDAPTDVPDFEGMFSETPDWIRNDGDERQVLVVEYYRKEYSNKRTFTLLPGGQIWEDDGQTRLPIGVVLTGKEPTRDVYDVSVCIYQIAGCDDEPLGSAIWNGPDIPIIPMIGTELQPFDGRRRRVGMIGPAKDAQRFSNFAASSIVERIALEPKAPAVGTAEQFEGYESEWQQLNTRNLAMLHYNPHVLPGGQLAPPPSRMQVDSTGMSISMMAYQEADGMLKSTTGVYNQSLGEADSQKQSGKAILALQGQSEATNGHFIQNYVTALRYEAKVILGAMAAVYGDRPGRIEQIIDGEGNESSVMLGLPFTEDDDGRPQQVENWQEGTPLPQGARLIDLNAGKYSVSVSIGKSHDSRLAQGREELGELLAADPSQLLIWGDIYMRFRDMPGAEEIAERLKKIIELKSPGLTKKEGEKIAPEQAEAQMQAAQQQIEQLNQALGTLTQQLQTEQAKQQATLQKAQMDAATKNSIAQMQADSRLELEKFKAAAELALETLRQRFEAQMQADEQRHEASLARADAAVSELAAERARRHGSGEAERGRESAADEAQKGRESTASEAERDREIAAEQAERDRVEAQADGDGGAE